jgi:hypothetical protein
MYKWNLVAKDNEHPICMEEHVPGLPLERAAQYQIKDHEGKPICRVYSEAEAMTITWHLNTMYLKLLAISNASKSVEDLAAMSDPTRVLPVPA